jgi:hypothetical protein
MRSKMENGESCMDGDEEREDELMSVEGLVEFVDGDGVQRRVGEEEREAGVAMFEEGEEERVDVVFLLNELLHEVRGLREEVAGLGEWVKPRTVVITPGTMRWG